MTRKMAAAMKGQRVSLVFYFFIYSKYLILSLLNNMEFDLSLVYERSTATTTALALATRSCTDGDGASANRPGSSLSAFVGSGGRTILRGSNVLFINT